MSVLSTDYNGLGLGSASSRTGLKLVSNKEVLESPLTFLSVVLFLGLAWEPGWDPLSGRSGHTTVPNAFLWGGLGSLQGAKQLC